MCKIMEDYKFLLLMYLGVFLALQGYEVEEGSGRAWGVGPLHSHFSP